MSRKRTDPAREGVGHMPAPEDPEEQNESAPVQVLLEQALKLGAEIEAHLKWLGNQ